MPATPPSAPHPDPGYYPDQAFYAPGWQAPAPAPVAPRRRRWVPFAVAGGTLVLALLVAGGFAVRAVLDLRPLGTVDGPVTAQVGRLGTGHCLRTLPADGPVDRVEVVPCDTAHAAEVVGVLEPAGTDWPGDQALVDQAEKWCEMGNAEQEAGYQAVVWTPSERSWSRGDREIVCLAWLPTGDATASLAD